MMEVPTELSGSLPLLYTQLGSVVAVRMSVGFARRPLVYHCVVRAGLTMYRASYIHRGNHRVFVCAAKRITLAKAQHTRGEMHT